MGVTVDELARRVNGQICGDGRLMIEGAESLEKAGPADITFVTDDRNLRRLKASQAGAVLVRTADVAAFHAACPQFTLIAVADPQQAFMEVLAGFRPARPRPALGISPHAIIDPSAVIGADCNIYPGVCIGPNVEIGPGCDIHPGVVIGDDCRIGAGCTLYPQVVLYAGCVLGNRVMVHASAILGADGFGYRFADGRFHKIPQLG